MISLFLLAIIITMLTDVRYGALIFDFFYSLTFHLLALTAYVFTFVFILRAQSLQRVILGTLNCLWSFSTLYALVNFMTADLNI